MSGDAELVTLFLEHGADASITNNVGATALDLARGKEHGPVIRLLEAHTAQDDAPLG